MNYSRITLETVMAMKKASGDDSPLWCREELLDPPDLGSTMAVAYSTFHGWRLRP
jgi:hypothetical protein